MSFDLDIGHATHAGPRPRNEDCAAAALPPPHDPGRGLIAAIADGVSTGGAGLEAAQATVLGVVGDFHATPATWDTGVALDRLIGAQNAWLADHNRRRQNAFMRTPEDAKIALTTLTVLVLRGASWTVAHVGDTRCWLVRDGQCMQLTQDHAYDEEFRRSRLTRAIGLDDPVRIDIDQGELRRGDVFVLTSDGVHGRIGRDLLARLAVQGDAQSASRAIVAAAGPLRDNATALVVRVRQLVAGRFEDALLPGRGLPAPRRLQAGDTLDGYVIEALLADTGNHRVYRARRGDAEAPVVIKALAGAAAEDPQARAMLVHEAWLADRIGERVAGSGEAAFVRAHPTPDASALYTVHDWHAGRTLDVLLAAGEPQGIDAIVAGTLAIARALGRLHRHGVIHRDIKPANLQWGDDGTWRVLDLGAARTGADPQEARAGTPSYMNPEQWGLGDAPPQPADAASDVYALGVTLYQWLTGKLPYGDIEPYQVGRYRRDPKPPSRLRADVPIWLDHLVRKAVALERHARFDTAEELVVALERGARGALDAPRATPLAARDPVALWRIALGASLLLNALLIYWLLFLPR